ncbi:stalk domain-containing protein [Gorillibacterium timonense]|uniref:stalk domain-containing protein n=1 Tax=Gorillibacterium timonense TaxID=1689269 RepID=UPI00071E0063|nr:stalk domain-containing protein [Gorillibacterium timonense]
MKRRTTVSLALMLSVFMVVFTAIPAFASAVPTEKYTYSLSGETGNQTKKIELEDYDDNQTFRDILAEQNYKIVLVKDGAEIKFTPKEKMRAVVSYYTVDGSYGGALTWTIDGSEYMGSELEANKTATVKLNKRYGGYTCDLYYVFSFGNGDNTTKIIYTVSAGTGASTSEPAEPTTPTEPSKPTEPATTPVVKPLETATATPSVSKVLVNGKQVSFEAYSINNSTYFKLRDIAKAVNGTDKNFEVGWDGEHNAISLTSGEAYTAVGGELAVSANLKAKKATLSTAKVYLDDEEIKLTAYTIGGNNYFKLRDLAQELGFTITFDSKTNTIGIGSSN